MHRFKQSFLFVSTALVCRLNAILKENRIPIEMVRASLTGQRLTKDFTSNWKFYGTNPGGRQCQD